MFRNILSYGTIAGLTVGIPLSIITTAFGSHMLTWGMLIGYTIMLIALSAVFMGVKRYRDADLGGVIGFWQALLLGLGISFVAGIIYVVAWESAVAITGMDFAGSYSAAMIAQKKAAGVSGAALAKFIAEMNAFKVQYANPLYRLPMTFSEIFPVGVLVSLLSAGLLRNRRFLPARRA
ncbi:MAG TPA: DUF4199 domain-containing protein [Rhizomicrobium sp.]|jgi:hypothetical protein|nr:DUF4199 domain-containing protein [Rhizomicrobium sp.]